MIQDSRSPALAFHYKVVLYRFQYKDIVCRFPVVTIFNSFIIKAQLNMLQVMEAALNTYQEIALVMVGT